MAKLIPGVSDAATTDPERSKMFVDPEVAKSVTRGSKKRALFQCPHDARHPRWEARVGGVIANGRGCPTCGGRRCVAGVNDVATTDPERSKMFVDPDVAKTVTRCSGKRALFRCLKDERHPHWAARVADVVIGNGGCLVCIGHRCIAGINDVATTDPDRLAMFVDQEVARLVTRSSDRVVLFRCPYNASHPHWMAKVHKVVARGFGCSVCTGRRCVTGINDAATTDPERSKMFVDQEFAKTVTRGSDRRATFCCLSVASHRRWDATVADAIAGGHGCPACGPGGFDPSKPGTLYVLDATTHIVFGITGNLEQRLKSYDDSRVLLHRFDFDDGGEARRVESAIKRQFKDCRHDESDLPGEMSESLTLDCLEELLAFVAADPVLWPENLGAQVARRS